MFPWGRILLWISSIIVSVWWSTVEVINNWWRISFFLQVGLEVWVTFCIAIYKFSFKKSKGLSILFLESFRTWSSFRLRVTIFWHSASSESKIGKKRFEIRNNGTRGAIKQEELNHGVPSCTVHASWSAPSYSVYSKGFIIAAPS